MVDFLYNIEYWHWLTLALVLVVLEIFGVGGFLIGMATAAAVVGILQLLGLIDPWVAPVVWFSILSVIFSFVYWKYFRSDVVEEDAATGINQRAAMHIGKTYQASQDVNGGNGSLQFGDTFWQVRSSQDIKQGDKITVIGADAMTLTVEKTGD